MRILLVGEFSGFHNNLKDGLVELGHEVTIASSGDGWKNFETDIDLSKTVHKGLIGKLERIRNVFSLIDIAKEYDILQFINYQIVRDSFLDVFFKKLKSKNRNLFVVIAGASPTVTNYCLNHLPYSPYHITEEERKYCDDVIRMVKKRGNPSATEREKKTLSNFKNVIPTSFSYGVPFEGLIDNLNPPIPMPINVDKFRPKFSQQKELVNVLYGLNRKCDKGHYFIKKALENLENSHGGQFSLDFVTRVSFQDYIQNLSNCDILIDQCKSLGYGMNALLGLSMGKVVLSGSEEIAMKYMGFENCPVVNITPDAKQIYNKLSWIIENKESIEEIQAKSRVYAETNHSHTLIAKKYQVAWTCR